MTNTGFRRRIVLLGVVALASCESDRPARLLLSPTPARYADANPDTPHVTYGDGSVSRNDLCPIRKRKLNLKMPPVYVNGQPIGFC
ncbi:MAG TPA: hypothetical protein VMR65_08705 [Candidatus Sulfotelmatobacter sp.]|jgi:hypothetical protein|nr:hypothetical protein [Candidatus Sulfotelmatobacter sp.]